MNKKIFSSIGIIVNVNNKEITQEFLLQYNNWVRFEYSTCSEYSSEIIFEKFKINDIIDYDTLKIWDKSGNYILFDYNKTNGSFIVIEENQELIYTNKVISVFRQNILFALLQESTDFTLQNNENPHSWRRKGLEIPNYVRKIPNFYSISERDKEIISIESLPGHIHRMNYSDMLSFGSCWQMYFSPIYYKYIPKFLFDNFTDCFENKVFENGLRRITLFENPEDYDLPENRAKQWAFRKALGIDSIAHELTKSNNRIEPSDLPIRITKQNCIKGTTRVTLFEKDKIIIKEFLDDGVTLVWEEVIS